MKKLIQINFLIFTSIALVSCSQGQIGQSSESDDLYFSSRDRKAAKEKSAADLEKRKAEQINTYGSSAEDYNYASNNNVDYSRYRKSNNSSVNGGNTFITNNYNTGWGTPTAWGMSYGYNPYSYFHRPRNGWNVSFGYATGWGWNPYFGFTPVMTPMVGMGWGYGWTNHYSSVSMYYGYGYSPYAYNPWGYGWGGNPWGSPWGYGYGYDPFFYSYNPYNPYWATPWYGYNNYNMGYYHGFHNGFYAANPGWGGSGSGGGGSLNRPQRNVVNGPRVVRGAPSSNSNSNYNSNSGRPQREDGTNQSTNTYNQNVRPRDSYNRPSVTPNSNSSTNDRTTNNNNNTYNYSSNPNNNNQGRNNNVNNSNSGVNNNSGSQYNNQNNNYSRPAARPRIETNDNYSQPRNNNYNNNNSYSTPSTPSSSPSYSRPQNGGGFNSGGGGGGGNNGGGGGGNSPGRKRF